MHRKENKLSSNISRVGSSHDQKKNINVGNRKSEESKDQVSENILLADLSIVPSGDTYYLYGTSQGELTDKETGFLVYTSSDLENQEGPIGKGDGGFAIYENDAFGDQRFWAPQVFEYNLNLTGTQG